MAQPNDPREHEDAEIAADDAGATAMAETRPGATSWTSPPNQQMDRSEDPELAAEEDREAAAKAMEPRNQAEAGSAMDVGSTGYDEEGAFDVTGASEQAEKRHPEVGDRAKPH